jgi:hypothetical protein
VGLLFAFRFSFQQQFSSNSSLLSVEQNFALSPIKQGFYFFFSSSSPSSVIFSLLPCFLSLPSSLSSVYIERPSDLDSYNSMSIRAPKCYRCGQEGHFKSDKKCPEYYAKVKNLDENNPPLPIGMSAFPLL